MCVDVLDMMKCTVTSVLFSSCHLTCSLSDQEELVIGTSETLDNPDTIVNDKLPG